MDIGQTLDDQEDIPVMLLPGALGINNQETRNIIFLCVYSDI